MKCPGCGIERRTTNAPCAICGYGSVPAAGGKPIRIELNSNNLKPIISNSVSEKIEPKPAFTFDRVNALVVSKSGRKILQRESELCRMATAMKKIKNWPEAIRALREVYHLRKEYHIGVPAAAAARLPNYLLWSGDIPGAWKEYQLVADLYYHPWYAKVPSSMLAIQMEAYGRMANLLFAKKMEPQAIAYGCASHLAGQMIDWYMGKLDESTDHVDSDAELLIELDSLMDAHPWSKREAVADRIRALIKQIPATSPLAARDAVYSLFSCNEPTFRTE